MDFSDRSWELPTYSSYIEVVGGHVVGEKSVMRRTVREKPKSCRFIAPYCTSLGAITADPNLICDPGDSGCADQATQ